MARRSPGRGNYKPNPSKGVDPFGVVAEEAAKEAAERAKALEPLGRMTSEAKMEGIARRAKRDGKLDELYIAVVRYILYVESIESDVHEQQLERMKRGKQFVGIAMKVRQEDA